MLESADTLHALIEIGMPTPNAKLTDAGTETLVDTERVD